MRRGSRQLKSILNYIDGQFVRGKREFADVNPADGSVIAQVSEADQGLVDDAVRAARKALHGEWGRLGIRERAARLHKVADAIEARFDCFVAAEVADTGKPVALASKAGCSARGGEFSRLRRRDQDRRPGILSDRNSRRQERAELCRAQAAGRCGHHHSLESCLSCC